eukprot:Clim_evm43s203 gene=Clim_evmTU43s203
MTFRTSFTVLALTFATQVTGRSSGFSSGDVTPAQIDAEFFFRQADTGEILIAEEVVFTTNGRYIDGFLYGGFARARIESDCSTSLYHGGANSISIRPNGDDETPNTIAQALEMIDKDGHWSVWYDYSPELAQALNGETPCSCMTKLGYDTVSTIMVDQSSVDCTMPEDISVPVLFFRPTRPNKVLGGQTISDAITKDENTEEVSVRLENKPTAGVSALSPTVVASAAAFLGLFVLAFFNCLIYVWWRQRRNRMVRQRYANGEYHRHRELRRSRHMCSQEITALQNFRYTMDLADLAKKESESRKNSLLLTKPPNSFVDVPDEIGDDDTSVSHSITAPEQVARGPAQPVIGNRRSTMSTITSEGSTSSATDGGSISQQVPAVLEQTALSDLEDESEQVFMCTICLGDFEIGEMLAELPCGHAFHKDCIEPWLLQRSHYCPVCKQDVRIGLAEIHGCVRPWDDGSEEKGAVTPSEKDSEAYHRTRTHSVFDQIQKFMQMGHLPAMTEEEMNREGRDEVDDMEAGQPAKVSTNMRRTPRSSITALPHGELQQSGDQEQESATQDATSPNGRRDQRRSSNRPRRIARFLSRFR